MLKAKTGISELKEMTIEMGKNGLINKKEITLLNIRTRNYLLTENLIEANNRKIREVF